MGNTWSFCYTDPLKYHRVECIGTLYMGITQTKDGGFTPQMHQIVSNFTYKNLINILQYFVVFCGYNEH